MDDESFPSEQQDFPNIICTTGTIPGVYRIKIDRSAKGVVHAASRHPDMLMPRIIDELYSMVDKSFRTPVEEPTMWVSSMVAAVHYAKLRICLVPRDHHKVIKPVHDPMKTIEEVVSNISEPKLFSVLDAKSVFLQILRD